MITDIPLISVCVANYNGMEVIDDCMRSIQAQTAEVEVEILIHDDASTDQSVAHIQATYPQAHLIVSDTNVGFCIANNRMAEKARGRYLLLLNNDAALFPDGLQVLLDEANSIGRPAILTLPQYDATTCAMVDRGCLLDPFYNPVPNMDPKRSDVAMVIGACLWIPKELWDELEGFPAWFGSIAEDMYLCCKARLAGYPVKALHSAGYRHWQGFSFGGNKPDDSRLSSTYRRRYLSERNKLRVMLITSTGIRLAWLMPLHLMICVVESMIICLLRMSWDYGRKVQFPAWMHTFQGLRRLGLERSDIQKNRRVNGKCFTKEFTCMPRKLILLWKYGIPHLK